MEARQAAEARQQVTALYRAHALGLVKLALLMVGDRLTAEDVVQDAFLGLYRRWPALYARSARRVPSVQSARTCRARSSLV